MKKIVLISTYFGSFPNYFNLWLKSAGSNESIDFLIFSDCEHSKYTPLPHNVKIVKTDFEALRKRIQGCYDFKLALNAPYKLCDFRPAFGEIFNAEVMGYDYWGNCDLDMIFGNIEKYIPQGDYDKIYYAGHLTLYKNTPKINSVYKSEYGMNYKDVFTTSINKVFDEYDGIEQKFQHAGLKTYTVRHYADITKRRHRFTLSDMYLSAEERKTNNFDYQVFYYENGGVYRDYIEDNQIKTQEFNYIHFSSRKMPDNTKGANSFYITNTGFYPKQGAATREIIAKYNPPTPLKDKAVAAKRKKEDAVRKLNKIIQKGKETR